jgi:hypothetical protein
MDPVTELSLRVGDQVRLTEDFQGILRGTAGVIFGFYRNDPPRYAVRFGGPARQVPPQFLARDTSKRR